MMFRVGQKVVCIGHPPASANCFQHASAQYPEIGDVITIRAINVWPEATRLRFIGIDNSHLLAVLGGEIEPGFNSKYFRPAVERKTDISIFTAMLTSTKRKVSA